MTTLNPPKFSIIIPLYNKENYIERALLSILNQTIIDFEIIAIDDKSTDRSLEKVESFNDLRIKIHKNTSNLGPSATRNNGIDKSAGKYLIFFDADDVMAPNYLEALVEGIHLFPAIKVFSVAYTNTLEHLSKRTTEWEMLNLYSYQKEKLKGKRILTASTFCCNNEIFKHVSKFDTSLRISEDPELFCRISAEFEICYLPKELIYYDISSGESLSKKPILDAPIAYLRTMKHLSEKHSTNILKDYLFMMAFKILVLMKKDCASEKQLSQVMSFTKGLKLQKRMLLNIIIFLPSSVFKIAWKIRSVNYK